MAKKIIFALFVISVLFLGFTVGRYTSFLPMTKASWAARSNQDFNKLDETEQALALAVAASSPQIAQEMVKYLKRGNVSADAVKAIEKMAGKAMAAQKRSKKRERPTFEEEMKNIQEFELGSDAYSTGKKSAPIQVVVFTEFMCPFCSQVDPTLHKLIEKYGKDKVNVTFQSFVVHGERAAYWHRVAYAAGEQGKFWEVADFLFKKQREWARFQTDEEKEEYIAKICEQFKLNKAKLMKAMQSDSIKKQIEEESKLARSLGVRGTPNVFINGRSFRGRRDFDFYVKVIDQLLSE